MSACACSKTWSAHGFSSRLSSLVSYSLPDSYFNDYISKINGVTLEDVNRAANKYLTPDKMAIVIVGDRKAIEPGIKDFGYPVTILNLEGDPEENWKIKNDEF